MTSMEETTSGISFIPAEEFTVSDLETLKVLADPLRLSIIECLKKPSTVKKIAEKIDKPPTKLYYHFNLLEKHGLIQMVDTRIVSGIVEKHYQASAKVYRTEPGLLSPNSEEFDERFEIMVSGLFGDLRDDLRASVKSGTAVLGDSAPQHRRVLMTQGRLALSPQRAVDFYDRLLALFREFDEDEDDSNGDDGKIPYKLMLLVHPSTYNVDGANEEDE